MHEILQLRARNLAHMENKYKEKEFTLWNLLLAAQKSSWIYSLKFIISSTKIELFTETGVSWKRKTSSLRVTESYFSVWILPTSIWKKTLNACFSNINYKNSKVILFQMTFVSSSRVKNCEEIGFGLLKSIFFLHTHIRMRMTIYAAFGAASRNNYSNSGKIFNFMVSEYSKKTWKLTLYIFSLFYGQTCILSLKNLIAWRADDGTYLEIFMAQNWRFWVFTTIDSSSLSA